MMDWWNGGVMEAAGRSRGGDGRYGRDGDSAYGRGVGGGWHGRLGLDGRFWYNELDAAVDLLWRHVEA